MILKDIYWELQLIKKELQAIRSRMEFSKFVPEDSNGQYFKSEKSQADNY